jgi:hypothetical protein
MGLVEGTWYGIIAQIYFFMHATKNLAVRFYKKKTSNILGITHTGTYKMLVLLRK